MNNVIGHLAKNIFNKLCGVSRSGSPSIKYNSEQSIGGLESLLDYASCTALILTSLDVYESLGIKATIKKHSGGFIVEIGNESLVVESNGSLVSIKVSVMESVNLLEKTYEGWNFDAVVNSAFWFLQHINEKSQIDGMYRNKGVLDKSPILNLLLRHKGSMEVKRRFNPDDLLKAIGLELNPKNDSVICAYAEQTFTAVVQNLEKVEFTGSLKDGENKDVFFDLVLPPCLRGNREKIQALLIFLTQDIDSNLLPPTITANFPAPPKLTGRQNRSSVPTATPVVPATLVYGSHVSDDWF